MMTAGTRRRIFISHNSADLGVAERVAKGVEKRGYDVWLDGWNIRSGADFQTQIEDAIRASVAAVVLIGGEGPGRWVQAEFRACIVESRQRFMPIIPVRLPGAPDLRTVSLFLATLSARDLAPGSEEAAIDSIVAAIDQQKAEHQLGEVSTALRRRPSAAQPVDDRAIFDAWALATMKLRLNRISEAVARDAVMEGTITASDYPTDWFLRQLPVQFMLKWRRGYGAALRVALMPAASTTVLEEYDLQAIEHPNTLRGGLVRAAARERDKIVVTVDGHEVASATVVDPAKRVDVIRSLCNLGRLPDEDEGLLERLGRVPVHHGDEAETLEKIERRLRALPALLARRGVPGFKIPP